MREANARHGEGQPSFVLPRQQLLREGHVVIVEEKVRPFGLEQRQNG